MMVKMRFNEICWVIADGNYTEIYTETGKYTLHTPMKDVEKSRVD